MPRMAARAHAQQPSIFGRTRDAAARTIVAACVLAAGLFFVLGGGPVHAESMDRETVFLPAGEGRTLARGPAGWTGSPQVTAVGCGEVGCPVLTTSWETGIGVSGGEDGALRARLSGLAGQSGTAVAVWRSPVVFVDSAAVAVRLGAATRRVDLGAASSVASTLTARLVSLDGAPPRTGVEAVPVGVSSGVWTSGPQGIFAAGALPLGALYRIEVILTFRFDRRASGALEFDLDDLGIAAEVPRAASLPGQGPPGAEGPIGAPGGADGAATDGATSAFPSVPALSPGGLLAGCRDDEIVVIGAAASGRRISVTGGSSRPPGTPVTVQSTDGWRLGTGQVDRRGIFQVTGRTPASARAPRQVVARLADGEASPTARIERANVLRVVRAAQGDVTIEGTLSKGARVRAATAQLETSQDGACGPPKPVASAPAKVDRRTGNYRAVLASSADSAVRARLLDGGLVRVTVVSSGPRLPRRVTTSQAILVDGSVIPVR